VSIVRREESNARLTNSRSTANDRQLNQLSKRERPPDEVLQREGDRQRSDLKSSYGSSDGEQGEGSRDRSLRSAPRLAGFVGESGRGDEEGEGDLYYAVGEGKLEKSKGERENEGRTDRENEHIRNRPSRPERHMEARRQQQEEVLGDLGAVRRRNSSGEEDEGEGGNEGEGKADCFECA
jgi:hypothetical protein